MTEFNNNNKYIPKTPETFTVSYLETNQEVKKSPLSPAARSKVIRKWGGNYVSARKGEINLGYGPMPQSSSSSSFKLTLVIGNPDCHHTYSFEAGGATFSSCTINGVDEAREWARKLGNGDIKVVDTKNNNARNTDKEKTIKEKITDAVDKFEKNPGEGEQHCTWKFSSIS